MREVKTLTNWCREYGCKYITAYKKYRESRLYNDGQSIPLFSKTLFLKEVLNKIKKVGRPRKNDK